MRGALRQRELVGETTEARGVSQHGAGGWRDGAARHTRRDAIVLWRGRAGALAALAERLTCCNLARRLHLRMRFTASDAHVAHTRALAECQPAWFCAQTQVAKGARIHGLDDDPVTNSESDQG